MLKVFKGIYFTILDQISLSLGTRKFGTMNHNLLTPRMDYKVISPSTIQYIFKEKRDEKRGNIKE